MSKLLNIQEAADWASEYLKKTVTASNISYLIQYGRVRKFADNGTTLVDRSELEKYYESFHGKRQVNWKKRLGEDLNWNLSFDYLRESDTTKHVHRLHPYKGKFIPQLVEYFLDSHTDDFKKSAYFKKGDMILDPFCGSGTTLVQASELGMDAVGIDISSFNALISNVKLDNYNLADVKAEIDRITLALKQFLVKAHTVTFEQLLAQKLAEYNTANFPSPDFKYKVKRKQINEDEYGERKATEFLPTYKKLIRGYNIDLVNGDPGDNFIERWYLKHVRNEIDLVYDKLKTVKHPSTQRLLTVVLSRTIRSCRATTHSDLGTLKSPITTTYYCSKHGKICKPLFSILGWWERYSYDSLARLAQFNKYRTKTSQVCITGDARTIDIAGEVERVHAPLGARIRKTGFKGVFSSPPYVGLIDYHEQHAYAYDLFRFERNDGLEIGSLSDGGGKLARENYANSIGKVLTNCRQFFADDFEVFLVANDKFNLYPTIAAIANMEIVGQHKRPVLNRTERDKSAYSESIFRLKDKKS